MRILFVAPWVPWAVRPRALGLLKLLSQKHDVHLLAVARSQRESAHAEDLPPLASVTLLSNGRGASVVRVAREILREQPLQIAYSSPSNLSGVVSGLVSDIQPDVVHLNVARTGGALAACASHPVIVDLDESRSRYWNAVAKGSPARPWPLVARIEAPRLQKYESLIQAEARAVLYSSSEDVQAKNSFLVPTPLDCEYWRTGWPVGRLSPPVDEPPRLLFVGRLHYRANVQAVITFAREILPGIRAAVPGTILEVVGESPPRSVRRLASPSVQVHGFVADLRSHYRKCLAAIVPISAGSGVQMKLIQGLAAGRPVITTTACARRAGVKDREEVLEANTAAEWASAVKELLEDPKLALGLAQRGSLFAEGMHSEAAVERRLECAYSFARR